MANHKTQANALKDQGNAALAEGKTEAAIGLYSQAIELDAENHVLFSNRSAAYAKAGQYEEALKDAERTVALQPSWPKGYSRKGAALEYMGKMDEALAAYEEGLKQVPDAGILKEAVVDLKKKNQL